jgi:predicted  nucleic acid-binding Zn-ribbon protein
MHRTLKSLIELQQQDIRLLELRTELAAFSGRFAELDARLAAARGGLEKAQAAQAQARKDRKKFELDVEQGKDHLRKFKDQSSQVKTNEAYKALLHEIEMAEQEIAGCEDRLLEEMVSAEEYDRQVKSATAALAETEAAVRTERETAEGKRAALQRETDEHEARRAAAVAEIPEDEMDHYTRIAARHGGIAVAQVRDLGRDQMCGMCGVRILPHVFEDIRRMEGDDLFHCETCTRIFYYVEPPPAPNPSAASNAASAAGNSAPSTNQT